LDIGILQRIAPVKKIHHLTLSESLPVDLKTVLFKKKKLAKTPIFKKRKTQNVHHSDEY